MPPAVVKAQPGLLYEEESRYQFIQVVQRATARLLYLNEGYAIHSVWRPDTVLTGGEWDMFLTAPPLLGRPAARVATLGNAGGTTARAFGVYYPRGAHRRRRDRPRRHRRRPPLVRPGRQPASHRAHGRRAPLPRGDGRALRPHPHRRLPPALRALLPGDARVLPALPASGSRPAASSPSTSPRCPATTASRDAVAGTLRTEFPQVVTWQALRFNQFVVGLTTPLPRAVMTARLAAAPARPPPRHAPLRPRPARGRRRRPTLDRRPRPVEWVTDRMIAAYALRGAGDRGGPPPHGARLTRR